MKAILPCLWRDQEGQTLVEYVLLLALMALAALSALTFAGQRLHASYVNINNSVP